MNNEKPIGIALLGCTGSIGTSTLEVLANLGPAYRVVTLAAGHDGAKLAAIAASLPTPPALLALGDPGADERLPDGRLVPTGEAALIECAIHPDVDLVVMATGGQAGFAPTLAALKARKQVALANKEALVMAGELVTAAAKEAGIRLRPIDSEHSAIWQCLQGETGSDTGTYPEVERLIITASGGAVPYLDPRRHPRGHTGSGAETSELEHGSQNHDRLSLPDEQGPGSDRGPLAF